MNKKNLIAVLCLLALAPLCRAASEGTTGAQFLRVGVDAKSVSLGETGAATPGARALFYNPAGLSAVKNSEAYFSYARWIGETGYSNLAFARNNGGSAWGVGLNYLSSPPIDKYDKFGNDLGETYTASDLAVVFGYAPKPEEGTAYGIGVKYVRSALEDETASAAALDAGIRWEAAQGRFALGLAVLNAGTKLKYVSQSDALPMNVKFGGQYTINLEKRRDQRKDVSLFAEANYMKDPGAYLSAGVDFLTAYDRDASFSVRAGYKGAARGTASGVTAGLGVEAASYSVDYAYAPMGDLGNTHRFSMSYRFGGRKRR